MPNNPMAIQMVGRKKNARKREPEGERTNSVCSLFCAGTSAFIESWSSPNLNYGESQPDCPKPAPLASNRGVLLLLVGKGNGGEGGIRTLVRVSPKHAFQACAFSHSATSPHCSAQNASLCAPDPLSSIAYRTC
jgi:hypothetical protein